MTHILYQECLCCKEYSCEGCHIIEEVVRNLEALKEEDVVKEPNHYKLFPDTEVIDVIRNTLSVEEFNGYCKGNILKYRLRAGKKNDIKEEIAKANVYEGWML